MKKRKGATSSCVWGLIEKTSCDVLEFPNLHCGKQEPAQSVLKQIASAATSWNGVAQISTEPFFERSLD